VCTVISGWSLDSVTSHSSCTWLPLHSASRSIHLHHHSRAARVLTANLSPSPTSPSQPSTARLTLRSAPPITAIHLRPPCPPNPADHALRRPNRNQLSSTTSLNSKPSSRPTVTSPSADSVLSSPVGNPQRRRFGLYVSVRLVYLLTGAVCLRTREKREEYISGTDQLQSCAIERLPASVRSHGSDFLRAWHCQTWNQGKIKWNKKCFGPNFVKANLFSKF
jgi:hypothetical protein